MTMTRIDEIRHSEEAARRWGDDAHGHGVGPQGDALILELQRLRQALDGERWPEQRRPPRRVKPAAPPPAGRTPVAKRRKKPVAPPRREQAAAGELAPPITPPEPAKRSEPARRAEPIPMNLAASPLEIPGPDRLLLESPAMSLPRVEGKAAAAGRWIAKAQAGLSAGIAFLLDRNGVPEAAVGESLMARAGWSFERELRMGLRFLLVALVVGGGWFALVPLAGAVVVPGNLVVQSNLKAIQHPTGGIVAEIKVNDGMHVSVGDLLVRLDATQTQASLQMVSKQLDELRARIARLVAERDGSEKPQPPAELLARMKEDNVASLLNSEDSLFKARAHARQSQRDLLQSRIAQLTEEISGLDAQVASKAKQIELITGELAGVQDLYDKHLVPLTRLTTLQREAARIDGERGQLVSAIAETKSKIDEAKLQIVRMDQDFRTDVVKELGETKGKEAELVERAVAARDQLDRIEIRAPTSGVIHQLAAHTIGGVIRAGDTIMEVVPDADELQVETRLQPNDIDQVHVGQKAFVRFSAFNTRTTPQLTGNVVFVSATTSHDAQTNASYYTVKVVLPDEQRQRLAGRQLVPGMPAEVFLQTGSRTMMSYIFKPIAEQMQRAFIEQ